VEVVGEGRTVETHLFARNREAFVEKVPTNYFTRPPAMTREYPLRSATDAFRLQDYLSGISTETSLGPFRMSGGNPLNCMTHVCDIVFEGGGALPKDKRQGMEEIARAFGISLN